MPLDGFPVIGEVLGVMGFFAAITHSGVALGPLVGQLLAAEILQGADCTLLQSFRPKRLY